MTTFSPNLALTRLIENQASAEVSANDTFNRLDVFVHMTFENRTTAIQPSTPIDGQLWEVQSPASGAEWVGKEGQLAYYMSGWFFFTPIEGMRGWDAEENELLVYDGEAWTEITGGGGGGGAPDDATYLTLTTNATLTQERVLTAGAAIAFVNADPNLTISIEANPTMPGTTKMVVPSGVTGNEGTANDGYLRFDTTTQKLRMGTTAGGWEDINTGGVAEASGPTKVRRTADSSIFSFPALYVDSVLAFQLDESEEVIFEFNLWINATSSTTQIVVSLNGPPASTDFRAVLEYEIAEQSRAIIDQGTGNMEFSLTSAAGRNLYTIRGSIENGASNNVEVRLEIQVVSGAASFIVEQGSTLLSWKL